MRGPAGFRWWGGAANGARLIFFREGQIRVRLYGEPCDIRKPSDELQTLVRHELDGDPSNGGL